MVFFLCPLNTQATLGFSGPPSEDLIFHPFADLRLLEGVSGGGGLGEKEQVKCALFLHCCFL